MTDDKAMTLRLPDDLAEMLRLVATVDGKPMSVVTREALAAHIERRRADPDFQQRVRTSLAALHKIEASGFIVCDDEHNCEPYGEHYQRLQKEAT
jgi:hypothetical protein